MSVLRSAGFSALCCSHAGTQSGVSAFWNVACTCGTREGTWWMSYISGFKASVTHHFSSLLTDQSGVATPSPGACGVGKYNPTIIWKEGTQKYHWTSVLTRWDSEHFGWQVKELRGWSLVGWCDQLNQTKGKWRGRIVRACPSFPKLIPVEYCWWKGLRVAAC